MISDIGIIISEGEGNPKGDTINCHFSKFESLYFGYDISKIEYNNNTLTYTFANQIAPTVNSGNVGYVKGFASVYLEIFKELNNWLGTNNGQGGGSMGNVSTFMDKSITNNKIVPLVIRSELPTKL